MKKRIFALASAAMLAMTATGCKSSKQKELEERKGVTADQTEFELDCGRISFVIAPGLEVDLEGCQKGDDSGDSSSTSFYQFSVKGTESVIYMNDFDQSRLSLKARAESAISGKEDESSTSMEECTIAGHQAYRCKYYSSMNNGMRQVDFIDLGDHYILKVDAANADNEKCQEMLNGIYASMVSNRPEKRTETQTFETGDMSITVSPDWYVYDHIEDSKKMLNVKYYDADTKVGYASLLRFVEFTDVSDSAEAFEKELADVMSRKNNDDAGIYSDIETGTCTYLGYDAQYMSFTNDRSKIYDKGEFFDTFKYYFFDAGGKPYEVMISSRDDAEDKFVEDIQPVLDSLKFK